MLKTIITLFLCNGISTAFVIIDPALERLNYYNQFSNSLNKVLDLKHPKITSNCFNQLKNYNHGLERHQEWALNMFQATGKFSTRTLDNLGFYDACLSLGPSLNGTGDIYGQYCLTQITAMYSFLSNVSAEYRVEPAIMQIATCLPNFCGTTDIQEIYSGLGIQMTVEEELCRTKATQLSLDVGAICGIVFFSVVAIIMLASTVYDVWNHCMKKEPKRRIFTAFSIFTNGRKLIAVNSSKDLISCLDGLRVITMVLIAFRHQYVHSVAANYLFRKNGAISYKINIQNDATLTVDTFLLLGGCVLSYNYLKKEKNAKFDVVRHYIHRYFRLTTPLAATMVFILTIMKYFGSGPLWKYYIKNVFVTPCKRLWWEVLLYIQNFSRDTELCIGQTWYLSAEFQMYLFSPIILISLKKWPTPTIILSAMLSFFSVLATFVVSWVFEIPLVAPTHTGFRNESIYTLYLYQPFYARFTPWLMGIFLGYALLKCKRSPVTKYKIYLSIFILLSSLVVLCLCMLVIPSVLDGVHDVLLNSVSIALLRPLWAMAVAFIIFTCQIGNGGPINWFLSLPLFQVLSRLTYSVFLVHTIVIFSHLSQEKGGNFLDHFYEDFFGCYVLSLLTSILLSLAFEMPIPAIEKHFGKKN